MRGVVAQTVHRQVGDVGERVAGLACRKADSDALGQ
jgi:hypothetical protein